LYVQKVENLGTIGFGMCRWGIGMSDYSFGIPKIDEIIGDIPKGTNIMLLGAPLTGKHLLIRHIIHNTMKGGNAAVFVYQRHRR